MSNFYYEYNINDMTEVFLFIKDKDGKRYQSSIALEDLSAHNIPKLLLWLNNCMKL